MKINRRGITRTVFVFKNFVIKVPNLRYGLRNFLRALLANIDEGNTWKRNAFELEIRNQLLCPVIWYTKTGLMLIMKRADVERHRNEMNGLDVPRQQEIYKTWIDYGYGGDDKPDNYGYLDNKLVKVDYSL